MPAGDLVVDLGVQAAYDALTLAEQRLTAQEGARPVLPVSDLPDVAQDEVLALAHALEVGSAEAGRIDTSPARRDRRQIERLEAAGRRGRLIAAVGAGVVVIASVLAALGPRRLGALVLVGAGLIVFGLVTQKKGDLRVARAQHSEASIQVAGAKEAALRFTQERAQAEERCAELRVPSVPSQLRSLAAQIAENATFSQRSRLFEEQQRTLSTERREAETALSDALGDRCVSVSTAVTTAFAAYASACQQRADVARQAGRRPSLEDQLSQRLNAEEMAADRLAARALAERHVHDALTACGLAAASADEAVAALEEWERERQHELGALDKSRAEWSELGAILGGRTFIELTETYQATEADAQHRASGLDHAEIAALAATDPTARLAELRQASSAAAETAAAAEGALSARLKKLASVSEAEEAEAAAIERLDRLKDLDSVLSTTQRFLTDAEERAQRDLAPVLAATLAGWLPRITGGRYTDAIIDIETLEVQVCGPERRSRPAKRLSRGTAEQVYLLLRAALARHLTTGKETCPLLLDDVTVQSDEPRTQATLDLLHELSKEQQVIVFAQERGVAEWAGTHLSEPQDSIVQLAVVAGT